jgi:transposase
VKRRNQQGEAVSMDKFREILRLHELGQSQCAISKSCAVARSTVQDYIRRAEAKGLTSTALAELSDSEAKERLGKGRSKANRAEDRIDFAAVDLELQRKGVTLALIWQEASTNRSGNAATAHSVAGTANGEDGISYRCDKCTKRARSCLSIIAV